jgi:hypothetical protein
MRVYAFAAAIVAVFPATACISWMSAEPQPDGSAIVCAKVEPTPDAGADASSITPTMRYVPTHAPVGAAPVATGAP